MAFSGRMIQSSVAAASLVVVLAQLETAWPLIDKAARAGYLPALQIVDQARQRR